MDGVSAKHPWLQLDSVGVMCSRVIFFFFFLSNLITNQKCF